MLFCGDCQSPETCGRVLFGRGLIVRFVLRFGKRLMMLISLRDNDGARYSIAAAALVVLIGAVAFSARKKTSFEAAPAA